MTSACMRQTKLGTQLMCMLQKPYKAMDYYLFSYFIRDHYLSKFSFDLDVTKVVFELS